MTALAARLALALPALRWEALALPKSKSRGAEQCRTVGNACMGALARWSLGARARVVRPRRRTVARDPTRLLSVDS